MQALFNRFQITLTMRQAQSTIHQGECAPDVVRLSRVPAVQRQLRRLDPADVAHELREHGAWSAVELASHADNLLRILWIAAGDVIEQPAERRREAEFRARMRSQRQRLDRYIARFCEREHHVPAVYRVGDRSVRA